MKTLAERLQHLLALRGKTQVDLARATGKTESAVSQWLSGETKSMRSDSLMATCALLGCNPSWLASGKGSMETGGKTDRKEIDLTNNDEWPAIRRVALKARAGVTGYAIEHLDEDGPPIVFRKDWYANNNYRPEKLLALRVSGESMTPNLYAGDLIITNTDQNEPKDGKAFVVSYEGEIVVKRLMRDQGQWWLTSDNLDQRRYPRKVCDSNTQIIGEVVYRQTAWV